MDEFKHLGCRPDCHRNDKFVSTADSITIVVHAIEQSAFCPMCKSASSSLKSHYFRRIADLPWHNVAIRLEFKVRKFRCRNSLCTRKVFCVVLGIRQDEESVQQAVISQWSNGQTEGQVNRLKTIKRQMYGRANFELLKARVLYQS